MEAGVATYLTGAAAFLVLTALLLTSWRGRLQGALMVAAALVTALWSAFLAFALSRADTAPVPLAWVLAAEIVRSALWLTFLLRLLGAGAGVWLPSKLRYFVHPLWLGLLAFTLIVAYEPAPAFLREYASIVPIGGLFMLALIGLILLEQLFRNSRASQRYAIKFLCIGLGAMFVYDLVIYSYALMLHGVFRALWNARGLVDALVVPLLAVAAARNPTWSLDVFVSRRMVFYSTTLLGAGIYLVAVAAGGYYIRLYGGTWGTLAEVIFVFGAAVVLLMLLFSGQARARVRVFVSKHFFSYRYDYREEWLRLIETLARPSEQTPLAKRSILALAQITDSPGGMLWMRADPHRFRPVANWNMQPDEQASEPVESDFARFLERREWIFDVAEWRRGLSAYAGVTPPAWLEQQPQAWIVVPLLQDTEMTGFVVLARSRSKRPLDWEDLDLLKTAGRQVASYLGHEESARKLAEARQFEGYNRLTAFVMHDLKNLAAQQSLMVVNAGKHKRNPAFIDDMIKTIGNSVDRMNRLLEQLRRGDDAGRPRRVVAHELLTRAIDETRDRRPIPQLESGDENLCIEVEADRFCAILGHVIRNAQDATPGDGHVTVSLARSGDNAIIQVRDDGEGMDANFIRERLFQPFFTTKSSKGMGVGAYQVREYVTAAGGSVDVASRPGQGTTFTISLPLAAARPAEEPPRPAAAGEVLR
ncbi:MAG TPA: XrtA/PEP-CTERM system histidine kinase PrsK [Gammaproteobacteria bacterium]|nr:XrtA/PEP-CTERM system histidine kinase PrsK [Gammaproteobacteria bacterium]